MIQFNLLPDVKLQYIKAQRQKRFINVVAFGAAAGALTILVLFFSYVQVAQKKHISDLNGDIKKYTATLKSTPDLDKILTIQNQLKSIPGLLEQRPAVSRLYAYIGQVTPSNVSISRYNIDFEAKTINVAGQADSLETINRYVDTYKFTTYTISGSADQHDAFTNVVLSSFSRDTKNATYEINLTFDPVIFDGKSTVTLVVPKTITTRSTTEQPSALFTGNPSTQGVGGR